MNEQKGFLSPQQNTLINFAGWAKYLAWIALISQVLLAGFVLIEKQIEYQRMQSAFIAFIPFQDYWDLVSITPIYYLVDIASDIIIRLLNGAIYFVVLKGISLGLYMVVETDINYREKQEGIK